MNLIHMYRDKGYKEKQSRTDLLFKKLVAKLKKKMKAAS